MPEILIRNDLKKHLSRLKSTQTVVVRRIMNTSKRHFDENFEKQGFVGKGFTPWPARRSKRDTDRPILQKSGRLRGATSIASVSRRGGRIVNNVSYAPKHNYGQDGMIERKFIGPSEDLDKKCLEVIDQWVRSIIK